MAFLKYEISFFTHFKNSFILISFHLIKLGLHILYPSKFKPSFFFFVEKTQDNIWDDFRVKKEWMNEKEPPQILNSILI